LSEDAESMCVVKESHQAPWQLTRERKLDPYQLIAEPWATGCRCPCEQLAHDNATQECAPERASGNEPHDDSRHGYKCANTYGKAAAN
jgi:hypothetical protein